MNADVRLAADVPGAAKWESLNAVLPVQTPRKKLRLPIRYGNLLLAPKNSLSDWPWKIAARGCT